MHKQCLLPFWHSGYQREIVMQSTNHLQHESNTMFQTPQSARQNRQLDCWGTSCLYQTVIWFSRKTNKVLHREMNPLNTVELWCGGQTCKNVQLASQLMQFYHATASKAVRLSSAHRSQPLPMTAAWRQLHDCTDLHLQKPVSFWQFPNMVYARPNVIVTGPSQHCKDWWDIVAWSHFSVLTSIRIIVCVFFLCFAAVSCLSLSISLWILTPASFCCKMVWSWPPSGTDQLQLQPWLASRYLEKEARIRERTNEQCHI